MSKYAFSSFFPFGRTKRFRTAVGIISFSRQVYVFRNLGAADIFLVTFLSKKVTKRKGIAALSFA